MDDAPDLVTDWVIYRIDDDDCVSHVLTTVENWNTSYTRTVGAGEFPKLVATVYDAPYATARAVFESIQDARCRARSALTIALTAALVLAGAGLALGAFVQGVTHAAVGRDLHVVALLGAFSAAAVYATRKGLALVRRDWRERRAELGPVDWGAAGRVVGDGAAWLLATLGTLAFGALVVISVGAGDVLGGVLTLVVTVMAATTAWVSWASLRTSWMRWRGPP